MLVRAAGTGSPSHTASVSESTDTGRLRLMSNIAITARCLAGPSGTRLPWTVISNGPKTPNPRPALLIARPASRRLLTALTHFERMGAIWNASRQRRFASSREEFGWTCPRAATNRTGCDPATLERGQYALGHDLVEQADQLVQRDGAGVHRYQRQPARLLTAVGDVCLRSE